MSRHYNANYPLRKVVAVVRRSQGDIDLRLECGHTVEHAIPYASEKSVVQLAPTRKRCTQCPAKQLRSSAAKELQS